jgi:hypothetical protein
MNFTHNDPNIKEFRQVFEDVAKECSHDGVMMDSHKIEATVGVRCENDDSAFYTLKSIDVSRLGGCGCASGPLLVIEREADADSWDFEQLMKKLYPDNANIVEQDEAGEYIYAKKEWTIWCASRGYRL